MSAPLKSAQRGPRGARRAVTVFGGVRGIGEQLEAQRREARPGRRRAGGVAGEDRRVPSASIRPRATSSWKTTPTAGVQGVSPFWPRCRGARRQVEVEAGHRSPSRSAAQARGETATMARPGAHHPAFWEPVTTTSRPQASVSNGTRAEAADAVHEDERLGCDAADDRGQRSRDGLVTPVEVSLWVSSTASVAGGLRRRGGSRRRPDRRPGPTRRRGLVTSAP